MSLAKQTINPSTDNLTLLTALAFSAQILGTQVIIRIKGRMMKDGNSLIKVW